MAIKLECVKSKHPQLHIEAKFYKMMQGGGKEEFVDTLVIFTKHCSQLFAKSENLIASRKRSLYPRKKLSRIFLKPQEYTLNAYS